MSASVMQSKTQTKVPELVWLVVCFFYIGVPQSKSYPLGRRLHNYGKSPFITAKSSITGPFSIATVKNYRRLPEGK